MGLQYFGPLAYLAVATPAAGGALALCLAVYATYGTGLALWALRLPKSQVFGYHELFHMSVVAGHVVSMAFDLKALCCL